MSRLSRRSTSPPARPRSAPRSSRRSQPSRLPPLSTKSTCLLIALLSVFVLCVLLYFLVDSVADAVRSIVDWFDWLPNPFSEGETEVTGGEPVIQGIRDLARLQTQEFLEENIVSVTRERGIGNFLEEKLVVVVCGQVTAGIDMAKITQDDIRTSGSKIFIDLPEAEIFSVTVNDDPDCTYVYDWDVPIGLSPSKDLESEARQKALGLFEQTALDNDILERAQLHAQQEVARFLLLTDYEVVEFTDTGEEILIQTE